jgi:hypothetical protein
MNPARFRLATQDVFVIDRLGGLLYAPPRYTASLAATAAAAAVASAVAPSLCGPPEPSLVAPLALHEVQLRTRFGAQARAMAAAAVPRVSQCAPLFLNAFALRSVRAFVRRLAFVRAAPAGALLAALRLARADRLPCHPAG